MILHLEHVPLVPLPTLSTLIPSALKKPKPQKDTDLLPVKICAVSVDEKEREETTSMLEKCLSRGSVRFTLLKSVDDDIECVVYAKKVRKKHKCPDLFARS